MCFLLSPEKLSQSSACLGMFVLTCYVEIALGMHLRMCVVPGCMGSSSLPGTYERLGIRQRLRHSVFAALRDILEFNKVLGFGV